MKIKKAAAIVLDLAMQGVIQDKDTDGAPELVMAQAQQEQAIGRITRFFEDESHFPD